MRDEADSGRVNPWPEQPDARMEAEPLSTPLEWKAPLLLLLIGLAVIVGAALGLAGARGAAAVLIEVAVSLAVSLPVTIAALYLVAALLGITFGALNSAVLKMASISVFSNALGAVGELLGYPGIGLLIAMIVSWYLFSLFFDLDVRETLLSILLLGLIQFAVGLMIVALLRP